MGDIVYKDREDLRVNTQEKARERHTTEGGIHTDREYILCIIPCCVWLRLAFLIIYISRNRSN